MIKELSLFAIKEFLTGNSAEPRECFLQVLGKKIHDSGWLFNLSDGFCMRAGFIDPSLKEKVEKEPFNKGDILRIQASRSINKPFISVHSYEVVMTGINGQIGNPISYEEFTKQGFSNPKGSNIIPSTGIPVGPSLVHGDFKPNPPNVWGNQAAIFSQNQNYNPNAGSSNNNPMQHQSWMGKSGGPVASLPVKNYNEESNSFQPISVLTIYNESWMIKGRVISKSDIRTWSNAKGNGKFFKIVIMDASGKIQASFFNSSVDKFFPIIVEDGVYMFSDGKLKPNYGKFNTTKHDYEISFEDSSYISRVADDGSIGNGLSLRPIEEIKRLEEGSIVDVAGIILSEGVSEQMTLKTGEKKIKRSIQLVDEGMDPVEVTIWGSQADSISFTKNNIITFRSLKLTQFKNEANLIFIGESLIISELPKDPRIEQLLSFRSSKEFSEKAPNMSTGPSDKSGGFNDRFLTNLEEVEKAAETLTNSIDDKKFFSVLASCVKIFPDSLVYPSCTTENCMKKAIETGISWMCNACGGTFKKPCYRYIGQVILADGFKQLRCKINNNSGKQLLGMEGNALQTLRETDEEAFSEELNKRSMKLMKFSIMAKKEIYNGAERINYTIVSIFEDPSRDNKTLLNMLEAYTNLSG